MAAVAPASPGATDFCARAAEAQRLLSESIAKAGLQRDPHRFVIEAESYVVGFLAELAKEIDQRRLPVQDDELRRAVVQGVSRHSKDLAVAMCRRHALLIAGGLVAMLTIGAGGGYWFGRGPDLQCSDQDGGRICYVWQVLPSKGTSNK